MHRDGHSHEAVMWYVHHLPESMTIPRRKQAVPRWKRVTEGRRPKDRSLKGGSLVSPGLASQRDRFQTAKQDRLLYQRHCSKTPRCRGVGTLSWAGPLTTSLRGLWVSGYLPRATADRAQGRRPDNRPRGDDSDPGLASRRERGLNCHQSEYSRTSVDCINAKLRREGTREPRRRGAICCCGLSRQLQARSGKTDGEDRPTSLPSSSTVVIQFIDKVLNFPVVLRKRRIFPL